MAERFPEPYQGVPLTTHPIVVKDGSAERPEYPERCVLSSEALAPDEVRVTALGTGYPPRRAQACAGFMVETGNGKTVIFDAGPGTNMAFNTLRLPYWKATRFFITHFHLDHITDLPVYYDVGQMNGRLEGGDVLHERYAGGAEDAAVALYTVRSEYGKGGGHVWFSEEIEGQTPNQILWGFLSDHRREE